MTYDEIGNPISYKGYSMAWTKAKQLASVSGNGITMSFKYDSNGIRTLKRVNGVDTEFTYAGTTLVSQKTGNEIINFAYTAGGAPYGFTYNGTNYFYLLNLQGDIIGIYDSNGDVVVKYAYDSWGQLMSITGTLADTIGVKNPLRYRGYYYDTETKLYYLQSRYYDPETCHFISMDSYFVAGDYINGMNMYAYCLNNPVMYVDPTGCAPNFSNIVNNIYILCIKVLFRAGIENLEAVGLFFDALDTAASENPEQNLEFHNLKYISVYTTKTDGGLTKYELTFSASRTPNGQESIYTAQYCYGTGNQWLDSYYYYKETWHPVVELVDFWLGSLPFIGVGYSYRGLIDSVYVTGYEAALANMFFTAKNNDLENSYCVMVSIVSMADMQPVYIAEMVRMT
ncbi:MAG: RHS repeat-associated core domain-containing protein [Clostridia bacterium]|nr:RHS repeat-associated core domain-containing protein [Clostridia bacterium]